MDIGEIISDSIKYPSQDWKKNNNTGNLEHSKYFNNSNLSGNGILFQNFKKFHSRL